MAGLLMIVLSFYIYLTPATVHSASLLLDSDLEDASPVQNPVYAFDGQHETVTLECVPEDDKLPKAAQTYEWRTINDEIIVNRGSHVTVDTNAGTLVISDVRVADGGRYYCNAIFGNEDMSTFIHNVVVLLVPRFLYQGVIVVQRTKNTEYCHEIGSPEYAELYSSNARDNFFCLDKAKECPFDFEFKYTTQGGVCTEVDIINQRVPNSYQAPADCQDLICIRDDMQRAMESYPTSPSAFFEASMRARKKDEIADEKTTFTDGMYTKCPTGYKVYSDIVCVPCEPGTMYNVSEIDETYCARCPPDTVQSSYAQAVCSTCPNTAFTNDDQTVCIDKQKGTFRAAGLAEDPYLIMLRKVNMTQVIAEAEEVKGYFGMKVDRMTALQEFLTKLGMSDTQIWIIIAFTGGITLFLVGGFICGMFVRTR